MRKLDPKWVEFGWTYKLLELLVLLTNHWRLFVMKHSHCWLSWTFLVPENSSVFLLCHVTRATLLSILSLWMYGFLLFSCQSISSGQLYRRPIFFLLCFSLKIVLFLEFAVLLCLRWDICFLIKQRWANSGPWRLFFQDPLEPVCLDYPEDGVGHFGGEFLVPSSVTTKLCPKQSN